MRTHRRKAFSLFELLVLLALGGILLGMLIPAVQKVREAANRMASSNNEKQLLIACLNYESAMGHFPSGNDDHNFSAAAQLLPYVEQANLYNSIDFKQPMTDKANATARSAVVKVFLSPRDPRMAVNEFGATNYLFSAGSKVELLNNNGVFYQNSKTRIVQIIDGTSNTLALGETLKGDGGAKAIDVRRQHVVLKAKEAAKGVKDETGVDDWKNNKHIAGDRCASWMDGRFLQGTFSATRLLNDERPDVSFEGQGGLSALRSVNDTVPIGMCDGSVRTVNVRQIKLEVWKNLADKADGNVIPEF